MHSPRVAAANRARLDLQRLYDYYLRTICGLLPSTPRRMLLVEFVAFVSVTVEADFAILERLGCIASGFLLPHSVLGQSY